MIRIQSRRMAVAGACVAMGLTASACATDSLFEEPLFWETVSLAADYAAFEAALNQCDWHTGSNGTSYQVCGDHRHYRHRPHRPHRPYR